jgi:hypothetical protein
MVLFERHVIIIAEKSLKTFLWSPLLSSVLVYLKYFSLVEFSSCVAGGGG